MTRHNGIAGGEQDHAVEHAAFHDEFDFIGDAVAARQFDVAGIFQHHAVADAGRHKFERHPARLTDALLHALGEIPEMDMPRIVFIP